MINSIKSAIVIGATGLVGKRLLYLLNESKRCDKITAIVRSENEELNKLKKSASNCVERLFFTQSNKY